VEFDCEAKKKTKTACLRTFFLTLHCHNLSQKQLDVPGVNENFIAGSGSQYYT